MHMLVIERSQWNKQMAKEVERLLISLIQAVPGVKNMAAISSEATRDFVVQFDITTSYGTIVNNCHLSFVPDGYSTNVNFRLKQCPLLEIWVGKGETPVPEDILRALIVLFPNASYCRRGHWEYFLYVGAVDLQSVFAQA